MHFPEMGYVIFELREAALTSRFFVLIVHETHIRAVLKSWSIHARNINDPFPVPFPISPSYLNPILDKMQKTLAQSQNGNNMGYDPMSVCKGKTPGTSGKENNRSRFPITQSPAGSTPIGAAGTAVRNSTSGGGGSGVDVGVRKFDLMPPPMPRTPGGSGSGGKSTTSSSSMSAMRTTPVVSPLRQHDPNKSLQHQQQQEQQQQGRPERSSPVATDGVGRKEERAGGGGGDGIQAGVQHKHKSGDKGISIQVWIY